MPATGLAFTVMAVDLDDPVVATLARHIALDILPASQLQEHMGLEKFAFQRVLHDPGFEKMVQTEKRRLLTLDGMREVNDWKALVLEGVYFDRLKDLALGGPSSPLTPSQVMEAVKITRRPPEKKPDPGSNAGGAAGPLFAININLPGEASVQVRPMPVIEGEVA